MARKTKFCRRVKKYLPTNERPDKNLFSKGIRKTKCTDARTRPDTSQALAKTHTYTRLSHRLLLLCAKGQVRMRLHHQSGAECTCQRRCNQQAQRGAGDHASNARAKAAGMRGARLGRMSMMVVRGRAVVPQTVVET